MNQLFPRVVVCGKPVSKWEHFENQIKVSPTEYMKCYGFPAIDCGIRIFFKCSGNRLYIDGTLEQVETATMLGSRIVILGNVFDSDNREFNFEKELDTSIGCVFRAR